MLRLTFWMSQSCGGARRLSPLACRKEKADVTSHMLCHLWGGARRLSRYACRRTSISRPRSSSTIVGARGLQALVICHSVGWDNPFATAPQHQVQLAEHNSKHGSMLRQRSSPCMSPSAGCASLI